MVYFALLLQESTKKSHFCLWEKTGVEIWSFRKKKEHFFISCFKESEQSFYVYIFLMTRVFLKGNQALCRRKFLKPFVFVD